jgi:hypothetical protein
VVEEPEPDLSDESENEEEDDVEVIAPPPPLPPVVIVKAPDGRIPPRKNVPIEVVEYEGAEDMFVREEPTINGMLVGKKGDVGLGFSGAMDYPSDWTAKYEADSA